MGPIIHAFPHLFARRQMAAQPVPPAPPAQPEGTTPMPPIPATQTAPSPSGWGTSPIILAKLEAVGAEILADVEAKAEPIAEDLLNELVGKLPFGGVLQPLADAVLRQLFAKLGVHPAVAGT